MNKTLSWVLLCLVILVYAAYILFFSVNFPFQDDFLLIQFIETVSHGNLDVFGLITELFRTFNDHKAVVPRFISLVEYTATGTLNYRFYIFLVTVNTIYIFYFLYLQFRKTRLPVYYFIPAAFLFFHPLYHDVSGWALNGMQHTFLTAFTVTAVLLASRKTYSALLGVVICCFLATFTHGNGILSYPAIVFYFLCIKDFKKAGIITAAMFASLGVYLIGYESGQAMHLPDNPGVFLISFFGFIGSILSVWGQPQLWSTLFGAVICIAALLLGIQILKHYRSRVNPLKPGTLELLSILVFICITSFVIALFRSWAGTTITSRFQLYTCMATVIFYIFLLNYTSLYKKRGVFISTLALSFFYWCYSFYTYTDIVADKKATYQADVYNWVYNRSMFSVPTPLLSNADFYLTPAYRKGIFSLPAPPVRRQALDSLFQYTSGGKENFGAYIEVMEINDELSDYERYYYLSGITLPAYKHFFADRYLVLQNMNTGRYYLKNGNPKVQSRRVILTKGEYYKPGFNAFFRPDDLNSGVYRLAILDIDTNGAKSFYKVGQNLTISDGRYSVN
jgi:hypothetical protein